MVTKCCVPRCGSTFHKERSKIKFHRFPANQKLKQQWLAILGIESVGSNDRLCGLHFTVNDYIVSGEKWLLKKCALPLDNQVNKENVPAGNTNDWEDQRKSQSEPYHVNEKVAKLEETIKKLEAERKYLEDANALLVSRIENKAPFTIENFKNSEDKIRYYTAFPDYEIFKAVFRFILPSGNLDDVKIYNENSHKEKLHGFKLSAEDQFFLVLIKMRQNPGYSTLEDMFRISITAIFCFFTPWINLMYVRLGSLQIWPHRNTILANAASNENDVIGSIDCTEFFINTPKSMLIQSQCYSHYKGDTTMKSLVLTDPNGAFLYTSSLFTGSISDKEICKKSGFIEVIKNKVKEGELYPNDTILADKGFNVADLFEPSNININIPVFRINGQQFSPADVSSCRFIAKERIHVERGIGRLKSYKILSCEIPIAQLKSIEQIYTVCCIFCNFRPCLRNKQLH